MLDALYLGIGCLAGLFLIAIFLPMMVLSGGREVGINVKSGDDIASWCMAVMALLGLAHTFKSGEMTRVGLLSTASVLPHIIARRRTTARPCRQLK